MKTEYVLAYDLGTSGIKAALVDTSGALAGYAEAAYPLKTPQPGWAEQAPEDYWRALAECTRNTLAQTGVGNTSVIGVSLCTQWKGMIPMSRDGRVLHNSLIWLDARAGEEAAFLNKALDTDMFGAQSYWARLMWLKRNRPEAYDGAECILEANSYLRYMLTGVRAADISNDFIHSYDGGTEEFYTKICDAAGIDRAKFPPLVNSDAAVGCVTPQAAKATGLAPGTPVFAGGGDIPAVTVGAGCARVGDAHAYFGTSGWIGVVVGHDGSNILAPSSAFTPDRDIMIYSAQSVGLTLNWAIKLLYGNEAQTLGKDIYGLIERETDAVPAGSCGLIATPWLSGEVPPLNEQARVAFIGAGANHDRRHFMNAIMESVCYSMRFNMERAQQKLGREIDTLTVVGGGANGGHWMQTLSNVLGVRVNVPRANKHAGAIGAAYWALMGLGLCGGAEELRERVVIEKSYVPDDSTRACYGQMYGVYKELFATLGNTFRELAPIRSR